MLTQGHEIEQSNNLVVVRLATREVSALQMQELVNDLMMRMRYDNAQHFIFDMQAVEFLSSACIGSMVAFLQDLEHVRGRIAMAGCRPDVLFLIKVTRLDSVFRVYDDVDQARQDIGKG